MKSTDDWPSLQRRRNKISLKSCAGSPKAHDTLTAADITNAATHGAKHNNRVIADIVNGLRSRREHLVSSLEHLPAKEFSRTALHPRLQIPIRLVDHLAFIAEHDDHHLARIWELCAAGCGACRSLIAVN